MIVPYDWLLKGCLVEHSGGVASVPATVCIVVRVVMMMPMIQAAAVTIVASESVVTAVSVMITQSVMVAESKLSPEPILSNMMMMHGCYVAHIVRTTVSGCTR